MNFAFAVSLRIEEIMDEMRPTPKDSEKGVEEWSWTAEDEDELYAEAMQLAIGESCGTAWAAGNIRIGEYILIIDSDTRVPTDCFLDAVNELDDSPQVAIIQHESDVMMVSVRPLAPVVSDRAPWNSPPPLFPPFADVVL
jgi:hypothetical protein